MAKDPTRASRARSPKLQNTVRLSADGVAKVLGDLEARVMHTVWAFGEPVPARTVHEQIAEEHDVSPLTVITVLNRLVAKRLLRRRKRDGLLHFEACLTEEEFLCAHHGTWSKACSTSVQRQSRHRSLMSAQNVIPSGWSNSAG